MVFGNSQRSTYPPTLSHPLRFPFSNSLYDAMSPSYLFLPSFPCFLFLLEFLSFTLTLFFSMLPALSFSVTLLHFFIHSSFSLCFFFSQYMLRLSCSSVGVLFKFFSCFRERILERVPDFSGVRRIFMASWLFFRDLLCASRL